MASGSVWGILEDGDAESKILQEVNLYPRKKAREVGVVSGCVDNNHRRFAK